MFPEDEENPIEDMLEPGEEGYGLEEPQMVQSELTISNDFELPPTPFAGRKATMAIVADLRRGQLSPNEEANLLGETGQAEEPLSFDSPMPFEASGPMEEDTRELSERMGDPDVRAAMKDMLLLKAQERAARSMDFQKRAFDMMQKKY